MENQQMNGKGKEKKDYEETVVTSSKSFNPNATPFHPRRALPIFKHQDSREFINIGPTQVPVNAKIWRSIASSRSLPELPTISAFGTQYPLPSISNGTPIPFQGFFDMSGDENVPRFDMDHNRDVVCFRRDFGPIATSNGVELRLKFGARVIISPEGAILLECSGIRVAVSSNGLCSAVEHQNGRIYQLPERVDVIAYDGERRNNYVRFAKIWKDCISFTAEGCALIYLIDTAGTRTTSDQVNRAWLRDYCKDVFLEGMDFTASIAAHYRYKIENDGTHVFFIYNARISQRLDGMIRVRLNDTFSVRVGPENRSLMLQTASIHCTASMSDAPHLFIRTGDRRIHFDGTSFVVRNMGHSSSFDERNNLRIH